MRSSQILTHGVSQSGWISRFSPGAGTCRPECLSHLRFHAFPDFVGGAYCEPLSLYIRIRNRRSSRTRLPSQISDAVLDAILTKDPQGRVACEVMVTTGLALVAGEITTIELCRYPRHRARNHPRDRLHGFQLRHRWRRPARCWSRIDRQSPDIAQGVDTGRRRRPGHDVRLRGQ